MDEPCGPCDNVNSNITIACNITESPTGSTTETAAPSTRTTARSLSTNLPPTENTNTKQTHRISEGSGDEVQTILVYSMNERFK